MERSECAEILTLLAITKIISIMRYPIKIQDVLKNDIIYKTLTSNKEYLTESIINVVSFVIGCTLIATLCAALIYGLLNGSL